MPSNSKSGGACPTVCAALDTALVYQRLKICKFKIDILRYVMEVLHVCMMCLLLKITA